MGKLRVMDVEEESLTIKVTLKAGHRMNYHSHRNRDEVWVVTSGTGRTIVDGMEQEVRAGDVITMQAGCRHTIIAEGELKLVKSSLAGRYPFMTNRSMSSNMIENKKKPEPFLLKPSGKDYLWWRKQAERRFSKGIDMSPLAETWECSTHPDGPSMVASGAFAGQTLPEVLKAHPEYLGTRLRVPCTRLGVSGTHSAGEQGAHPKMSGALSERAVSFRFSSS